MRKKISVVLILALLLSGVLPLIGGHAFGATASIEMICGGRSHSLALDSTGKVWAWGLNSSGQLGDATNTNKDTPTLLDTIGDVTDISASIGAAFSLALKSDGTVWAWGANDSGQLGNGTTTGSNIPVQVSGLSSITTICTANNSSYALKSDGTLWAWGANDKGQLGIGGASNQSIPVQVTALTNVAKIFAGENHAFALKENATLWAWGFNSHGQLGDGTTTTQYTPVEVTGIDNIHSISSGSYHTLALKTDATLWGWGSGSFGKLGNGISSDFLTPIEITALENISSVSTSYNHSIVAKNDGSLWAFGVNSNGQLGDGTTDTQYGPIQIDSLTNVNTVSLGYSHSFAIKDNGTVWAWGSNGNGQVGNGTTTDQLTPVQIFVPVPETSDAPVLDVMSTVDAVDVGEIFTVDVVLKNVTNICAEDVSITYDTDLFEYVGTEDIDGFKIYHQEESPAGTLRYITASLGESYAITGEDTILKLTFKAVQAGEGTIDAIKSRIADNGQIEVDIATEDCGEKTITVNGYSDVNRSGAFTLLDLGIDAWYFGSAAADTDTTNYDTDVVVDDNIDDLDLAKIVEQMLANPDYTPNN